VAWIGVVFVSILIHELGHAFTARAFGSAVAIELNGLGGLTRWAPASGVITPGPRALIAAAGSAVGLVFGGLVWLVATRFAPFPPLLAFVLESTIYVNVFWGLVNWLPIRPLDGGHLLESLLEKVAPARAEVIARVVFILTAAGALAWALLNRLIFVAVLSGWLLLSEFGMSRRSDPAGLPTLSYQDERDGEEAGQEGTAREEAADSGSSALPEEDPPDRPN
jgi:membrane-associated protease RseP (regulator of RpoE activity)